MDETARQLRAALATEGQMGTATITYVWPLITAALEQAHHDGRREAADAIELACEAPEISASSYDVFMVAARVARGDAL